MRRIICVLSLALVSCGAGFAEFRNSLISTTYDQPYVPQSVPESTPIPRLRVFECDRDHCHQTYRVSPDMMDGKFFLEGEHEPDTLMEFIDEKAFFFYSPTGPAVRKMAVGGPVMVTPFTYVHRFGKVGTFHVRLRRTRCGGQACEYLAQNKPAPPHQAADLWVSAEKASYPPPPKPKPTKPKPRRSR